MGVYTPLAEGDPCPILPSHRIGGSLTESSIRTMKNNHPGLLVWHEPKESKMPIHLNEEHDGKLLVVHVSGKLTKTDYAHFVPEFERLVQKHGKVRILFDMTGFHGWEAGALWEDIKFDVKHFADIERLAMIGETKWESGMASFCKVFTKATIRYFDHAQAAEAQKWVDEA